jgi:hypothetical protein
MQVFSRDSLRACSQAYVEAFFRLTVRATMHAFKQEFVQVSVFLNHRDF